MKKYMFLFIILSISLLFAETLELKPSDDMYTDPDHQGTEPVSTELWTANFNPSGHYERIMVKFDLSDLEGKTIESAKMYLTRFFSCPSSGTTVTKIYPIAEDWTEETWNHTIHISYDDTEAIPYSFSGNGGTSVQTFEIDLMNYVELWTTDSFMNKGIVIVADNGQKFSKFFSKEAVNEDYHPILVIDYSETAVENIEPEVLSNCSNYPNPFNPKTTISFNLKKQEDVKIDIYNLLGQKVKTLCNKRFEVGHNSIEWNGLDKKNEDVSSGVYFYKIQTEKQLITKKMILIK